MMLLILARLSLSVAEISDRRSAHRNGVFQNLL
jgi:hypothetical protein